MEGETAYFHCLNRGKRSVALDLKDEQGRKAFHRLAETSDVVLDNFRRGVTERLGVDHETLSGINPKIVTCSMTGYGETGPKRDLPAYDYLIQAMSGMMSLTGDPGGKPTKYGISIVDPATGLLGAFSILAALRGVGQTGTGRHVDLSLLDAHVHMLSYLASDYLNGDLVPERYADSAHPYIVPSQRFATSDGDIVTMPMTDHMWRAMCEVLELEELGADADLATAPGRLAQRERVIEGVAAAIATHTTAHIVSVLEEVGVPVAPVNSVAEILADPQIEARGLVVEGDGVRMLGNPIAMSDVERGPYRRAPHIGEHTRELLDEVGLGPEEIEALWPTS